jgi:hypothetical protein
MKWRFFLLNFTRVYGVLKFLQFLLYLQSVLKVIAEDDCEKDCFVEYFEALLCIVLLFPVVSLIYGSFKVEIFED